MSIKAKLNKNKLILEFDGIDRTYLNEAMLKWDFETFEQCLRFTTSILLAAEENKIRINYSNWTTLVNTDSCVLTKYY